MTKQSMEDKKELIAKIATAVFGEKGYRTSSLQDVAEKANISKAGLYHYFKSKEEILAHILLNNSDFFLEKLKASIQESAKAQLSPRESFKNLIQVYAQQVNSDKDLRLIVLRERHQLSTKYMTELLKREQEMYHLLRDELQKIPDLEENMNRNVITFLFIGMSHWLGYWFREGGKEDMVGIIDQNIHAIFHGMLKR
ncbi:MAG: TetR/AcrR family transcriptional regulator [Desulfatibacillum sp.]|nr:TetR/AcrR family transcriptional regulator [Desulfatibacillum sp.]